MDIREYQKESYRAIQPHDTVKDEVIHWTVGLSEEVGEVASHIKHFYYGGEVIQRGDLAMELGDVLWHVCALATALGLDINDIIDLNRAKLHHRFPGEQFDFERSMERESLGSKFKDTKEYQTLIEKIENA